MRHPILLVLLGAAISPFMAVLSTARADACSYPPAPPTLQGYPGKDAIDVPLDVLPIYAQNSGTAGSASYLLTTAGRNVDFTVEDLSWGGARMRVIRPSAPLSPNTLYLLQGVLGAQVFDAVQFMTGTTAVTLPPAPPSAFLRHWQLQRDRWNSCGPSLTGTCIALPADMMVESTFVKDAADTEPGWPHGFGMGPLVTNLSGIDQGHSFPCIKLRARGKNGVFSDPAVFCGDQAPLSSVASDKIVCTPAGLTVDGKVVAPDGPPTDGGADADPTSPIDAERGCSCSILPSGDVDATRAGGAMTFIAALSAALRRRKRRP